MTSKKSGTQLYGQDLPQDHLVKVYSKSLSKDRERVIFDDQALELLKPYLKEGVDIDKVVAQADSISYSQANYEYAQIETQIQRFEDSNHQYFGWNKHFKKAVSQMRAHWRNRRLNSLVYRGNSDIMDRLPRRDTHAGSEKLVFGMRSKGEYEEVIFDLVTNAERIALEEGTFNMPIMIGSRTQASSCFDEYNEFIGSYKKKTRLVSMIALRVIVSELRWAKPIQSLMSYEDWYAGGKNDPRINTLLNQHRQAKSYWLSVDYSQFDQSISNWLIHAAFSILEDLFIDDSNHNSKLYWIIVNDFVNKRFIDGNGEFRYSNKGVPSGSMFTQIIDTIVNRLMILTYLNAKGIRPEETRMLIMGDDNIIFTSERIDRDDLEGYLNKNFGVKVNGSKSSEGTRDDDPEFLSRYWAIAGAYRPWKEVICKLLYPERYRDYGNGKAIPRLVVYSYVLAYMRTMDEIMDVDKFLSDSFGLRHKLNEYGVVGLSGYMAYNLQYNRQPV